jgi:hypothetical protein
MPADTIKACHNHDKPLLIKGRTGDVMKLRKTGFEGSLPL